MTPRSLVVQPDPLAPVAQVVGDVDAGNAEHLLEALAACVPNGAQVLLLDLSGATYLDSAGLQLLFRLARALQDRQQVLRLLVPHASLLHRVLVLACVADAMEVVCEHEEARDLGRCPRG